MGSIEAACVGGFLCRLCSEVHRLVIHVYSDKGIRYGLAKKINAYLPVSISPEDPLPKTICKLCMDRLIKQHEFMVRIHKNHARLKVSLRRDGPTQTEASSPNSANEKPSTSGLATQSTGTTQATKASPTKASRAPEVTQTTQATQATQTAKVAAAAATKSIRTNVTNSSDKAKPPNSSKQTKAKQATESVSGNTGMASQGGGHGSVDRRKKRGRDND